ncbi:MAG: ferredoxin--nitrite reductase [Verrucomicrobiota bacterium]
MAGALTTGAGLSLSSAPAPTVATPAALAGFHGVPIEDLCQQEKWKHAALPLDDNWERLLAHAATDRAPDAEHNFRFRWHGLFHVAPAQDSYMLRLRLPGCGITSHQLHGLADLATELCGGYAHVTTRGNLQLREIRPKNAITVLMRLAELGLSARGSGADNLRNITASPDSGFAPDEVLDVRPYALALGHYVFNHRDLYDLPRKFNIAFDNGGSLTTAVDTNDLGFQAVRVTEKSLQTFRDSAPTASSPLPAPGLFFRVLLGGISGHKDFARDTGILLAPDEAVPFSAAVLRAFSDHGDRTNRKKARLKYILDAKGTDWFLAEVAKRLSFPLRRVPLAACEPRRPVEKHAWLGPRRQSQPHLNSLGVGCPVGRLTPRQMHRLADLAQNYGKGELRFTVYQNVLIPHLPDAFLETVKRAVVSMGLYHEAGLATGGIIACTGSWGCKYASADTKAHALALIRELPSRVTIDQPVNIHVTGCAHTCAQHYCGDLGFISTKLADGSPGYHMVLGGGMDHEQGIAREVFKGVRADELTATVVRVLDTWQKHRATGESFVAWSRRHEVKHLQELLS